METWLSIRDGDKLTVEYELCHLFENHKFVCNNFDVLCCIVKRDGEPAFWLPVKLRYIEAHSLTHQACVDAFKGGVSQPIYDTMICALNKPKAGACFGDSGIVRLEISI